MKKRPKIRPRLMWAAIAPDGYIYGVEERKYAAEGVYSVWKEDGENVQRVLVTAPPKRRKRK